MKNLYTTHLERSDLIELEGELVHAFRKIITFSNHSLYFPREYNTPSEVQWIAKERTLLIPLCFEDKNLGVFMARGVKAREARRILPNLATLSTLCLEHLLCIKQSRTDELTGLTRMSRLLLRMEHDADMVSSPYVASNDKEYQSHAYKACMGLIVIKCHTLQNLASEFGYMFINKAIAEWAKCIQEHLPKQVVAARSAEGECTILVPAATRTSCSKLAEEIIKHVNDLNLAHSQSKRTVKLQSVAGIALYPQDMENKRVGLPMSEKAHHLLYKARLAASTAFDYKIFHKTSDNVLPYAQIIHKGGLIRDVLPHGQILTNLGQQMGAHEGQCYSVWDSENNCKGEIVLIEVKPTHAIAEAILHDPAYSWQQGDRLHLEHSNIEQVQTKKEHEHIADDKIQNSDSLLNYTEFLRRFTWERETKASFTLALLRLKPKNGEIFGQEQEKAMQTMLELCNKLHAKYTEQKIPSHPTLCGKYGQTSLMFFYPSTNAQSLEDFYISFVKKAEEHNLQVAVGIAAYPYLQCSKGDIVEYCHKALELALLLPSPQVGLMGSLALNISADQNYSRGNLFEAVEEYKLALLDDASNAMAWNSLGVCMAALSRPTEAKQYFKEALKLWKKHPPTEQNKNEYTSTLYNLGTLCQNLAELRSAAHYFRQCIKVNSNHYFAHIRLGQLAENSKRYRQARQYFNIAASYEDLHKEYGGMARRHLARVALRQRKDSEARELIHEALLRNPQDAIALCMLAKLYLDSGEDPSMSEMLARKSVGLRPEYTPAWQVLGLSLRALGREKDALQVEQKVV